MRNMMLGFLSAIIMAMPASAKTVAEIKAEIAAQGLEIVEEKFTLLWRIKIEAVGPSGEREIVLTRWGRVLKDQFEFEDENLNGIHDEFEGFDD